MTKRFICKLGTDRRQARPAFTLIELLVVIGIIALLVSLTMPAINAARETARRITCSNNIRQLGLAVVNYETTHKRLPPSGLVEVNPDPNYAFGTFDPRSGKMISWVVLVLPYFEQDVLYQRFDLKRSILQQPLEPQQTYIETLACPSDAAQERHYHDPVFTEGKTFAKGNYAAYVSPYHVDLQYVLPGALGGNGQRMRHIRDGVSNTIMLSEVLTSDDPLDQRGVWALPWNAASILAYDAHYVRTHTTMNDAMREHATQRLVFELAPAYRRDQAAIDSMQTPNKQWGNVDVLYSCQDPQSNQFAGMPCGRWAKYGADDEDRGNKVSPPMYYLSAAPRSNHLGGVNVVSMDGHVTFLRDEVDPIAMAYLVSVHDRPAAEDPRYDED